VGTGCGHLKTGAPARGERVAKYNRLMEIAAAPVLRYGMPGADHWHGNWVRLPRLCGLVQQAKGVAQRHFPVG
jgi:Enolase, C-terminal TIM barrel domain